ncbi:hypothetical protein SAMN02949497_3974 [Methylomagnum ishizawai]|uniref:Uncharacterized protein n=1 Tax=Methylomagnum ishizawai TaxID=1760988 RepID=A0A1Y6D7Z8_9GAMM|nr:hypothetical protein [Methylomagnum ishizawai]SMF96572.1 hypothetical protein SAMN02949497_3974 [Methylomagnum ishizawai]
MWNDPIVEELHRVREDHAARFNGDLRAIAEDLRRVEETWPAPIIDPPPKPPIPHRRLPTAA